MKKKEAKARFNDILYFIYKNRICTISQIYWLYFDSYDRARLYLSNLQKQGYLKHMYSIIDKEKGKSEKVYYLSYKGIIFLNEQGYEQVKRYSLKPGENQIRHDLLIVDILIHLLDTDKIDDYTPELFLRREMFNKKHRYRIPDLIIEDNNGKALIEVETTPRSKKRIIEDLKEYSLYYKNFRKIFVVYENRIEYYDRLFKQQIFKDYFIYTFHNKKLRIRAKG